MHEFALLKAGNQSLRHANEELNKRQRAKKVLQDERDVEQQVKQEAKAGSGRKPTEETRARRIVTVTRQGTMRARVIT